MSPKLKNFLLIPVINGLKNLKMLEISGSLGESFVKLSQILKWPLCRKYYCNSNVVVHDHSTTKTRCSSKNSFLISAP